MAGAGGAYCGRKKRIAAAVGKLADEKTTADPFLLNVTYARKINAVCGFGAVTPWDVGQLDEAALEEVTALYEFEREQETIRKEKAAADAALAKARNNHPQWRR